MAYSSIVKPSVYFNTKLYSGQSGDLTVTGVGFQPDWTWIKHRNGAGSHVLTDAVRGVTKELITNNANAETTSAEGLQAFLSDGFRVGDDHGDYNRVGRTYASWNWKAGGGQGSANTDGTINTTYTSVNTTAGFSISKYTGTGSEATVGHGLGVTPKIVFFKRLDSSANWVVQTPLLGNRVQLVLNDNSASNTDSRLGASDNWSNSVFTVGTYGDMNASGGTHVAYCFAEKTGYSKFGSYTGNGNADGPFIYCGFKPAFLMVKKYSTGTTTWWQMTDNKRGSYNQIINPLYANVSDSEYSNTIYAHDFLSNGIKVRGTNAGINESGASYIYMAFAEEPLVANSGTDGVPATAR